MSASEMSLEHPAVCAHKWGEPRSLPARKDCGGDSCFAVSAPGLWCVTLGLTSCTRCHTQQHPSPDSAKSQQPKAMQVQMGQKGEVSGGSHTLANGSTLSKRIWGGRGKGKVTSMSFADLTSLKGGRFQDVTRQRWTECCVDRGRGSCPQELTL